MSTTNKKTNNKITYYASETPLEDFYRDLAYGSKKDLKRVHIPLSDVFLVRKKYYLDTGNWITLDRMERSMYLEGMVDRKDVLDPDRKRDWE